MAFLKRLGFYLVGLSIGIVFLTLFLKKKSDETGTEFCYFPNCRTLKDIRSKPISYSDEINRLLEEEKLDTLDIAYFLKEGEVDFRRSDTKSEPCKTYFITGTIGDGEAILEVKNCRKRAIVQNVLTR